MFFGMDTWASLFHLKISVVRRKHSWNLAYDNTLLGRSCKQYRQYAFARFCCSYCDHSWASAHVLVLFHMKLKRRRGTVKMRVFKQSCKFCRQFEEPVFELENMEIVLNNLIISIRQQCYGEDMEEEMQSVIVGDNLKGPHQRWLCEACDLGVCYLRSSGREPYSRVPAGSLPSTFRLEAPTFAQKEDSLLHCCCCCCLIAVLVLFIIIYFFLINVKVA
ncbi:receptor-transporting protein 3 [Microcaecilia unicolor]|uniref:Receptor-transporting protein 3-like n=1 Tax=Microcaecilia unicolor TaxID=1415580 RepID=A0A6P7Z662_9AMPH|nr:receptor-transporting protein 3-like [Microcaecilia unicolor]